MAEETAPQLTESDLSDFARQLFEWTKTLPEVQQGLLHRILTRAAGADTDTDDAEGYIIVVGGLTGRSFLLESGAPSPLVRQAVGLSDLSLVKRVDKSTPILF